MKSLFASLVLIFFAADGVAQPVSYFEYTEDSTGAKAKVYLPGSPDAWRTNLNPRDSMVPITKEPKVFIKGIFQKSDNSVEGVIRIIEDLQSYDAASVFDELAAEVEGLQRVEVRSLYKSGDTSAYLFEYLHPDSNRMVAVKLLSNPRSAIEVLFSVPNNPGFREEYTAILNGIELELPR